MNSTAQYQNNKAVIQISIIVALVAGLVACIQPAKPTWSDMQQAEHRSHANIMRDEYRHPTETLAFFEVEPCHTVVEIWPGAGWYTEILAPVLRSCGTLHAAHFSPASDVPYFRKSLENYKQKLADNPRIYDAVVLSVLQPPSFTRMISPGTADRVLTFRNVHNWLKAGTAEQVFASAFEALKPGGVFGVVEHRAKPGTDLQTMIDSGYVTEAKVVQLAEAAGFKLLARSEINANPLDDTVYPKGVWTLPPSLRLGDEDRMKYLAIGESDRMTLKFVKPANG
ncbi:putative methyltransferase [Litorivivens lipolytica]|uniref:Putative methyltransferase n=1 Tax=Litorivivens lipolytica TaxID=1524264 RepID=A0A7W4Z5M8_9GAMM|nr:putative methyltransferase [Litorivivens lipolytica]